MMKQAITMVALAAVAAVPPVVGAQAATPAPLPAALATCDCPAGDARGGLRDLAAFAPLGLLGALAAAGGTPGLFAAQGGPSQMLASNGPVPRRDPDFPITESGRTTIAESGRTTIADPPPAARVNNSDIPLPVPPDSLRGGVRAPNTATPLPSVFLLGTGLVAIGCVTLLRTRG